MQPQDPLAQLRDIHLPQAVSPWPPAPGWWIVALIVMILIAVLIIYIKRRIAANRYRKLALAELKTLDKTNSSRYLQQLNQLLKQTALASGCNESIGSYSGYRWLIFLDNSFKKNGNSSFTKGIGEVLATGPYAPQCSFKPEELESLARRWIKNHNVMSTRC